MEAKRILRNGVPELSIGGAPPSPGFGRLQQPNYWALEKLDQFIQPDFDLFYIQVGELNSLGWCWDGADGYDYSAFELLIDELLEKKPDSRFILFIGGRVPYGWQMRYPEELVLRENGVRTNLASPGSARWIADSSAAVRHLVEHFENGPWADAIAGYNPIYNSNEWLLGGFHTDYSEGATARWRAWLHTCYEGDEVRLRRAWKQPDAEFEQAPVPREADYNPPGLQGMFDRHERLGAWTADYLRFFNDSVSNLVVKHAEAVKTACGGRKLVSVMFGYTYSYVAGNRSPAHSGHLDFSRALASPHIDVFHAPFDYYNRSFGGVHYSQYSADSIAVHRKVFASQIDTKTHVHRMHPGNARTPWESEQILKRDVAFTMMRNAYHYYYEMCVPAWRGLTGPVEMRPLDFSPPNVQEMMVKLRRVAEANHRELPAKNTEVALFNSRESAYYREYTPRHQCLYLQGMRNFFLCYAATPFHDYILEDFEELGQDFKVYIFPDASFVSARQREAIRERLERIGATAIWFYAPGYCDEDGTGVENMEALTGIRFRQHADLRDYLQIDIDRFDHPVTQGLEAAPTFGSQLGYDFFQSRQEWLGWKLTQDDDYRFTPIFTVDDPEAETLGTLRAAGAPGFVRKQVGGMTSIYIAAPCPTPEVWMNLFRSAGAHVYSDTTDLVYANARYIALCANGDGTKTLRLPGKADLYEALGDTLLARDTDHYTFEARHGQVELFRMG